MYRLTSQEKIFPHWFDRISATFMKVVVLDDKIAVFWLLFPPIFPVFEMVEVLYIFEKICPLKWIENILMHDVCSQKYANLPWYQLVTLESNFPLFPVKVYELISTRTAITIPTDQVAYFGNYYGGCVSVLTEA